MLVCFRLDHRHRVHGINTRARARATVDLHISLASLTYFSGYEHFSLSLVSLEESTQRAKKTKIAFIFAATHIRRVAGAKTRKSNRFHGDYRIFVTYYVEVLRHI